MFRGFVVQVSATGGSIRGVSPAALSFLIPVPVLRFFPPPTRSPSEGFVGLGSTFVLSGVLYPSDFHYRGKNTVCYNICMQNLSIRDYAREQGVSTATVRDWLDNGYLTGVTLVKGRWVIPAGTIPLHKQIRAPVGDSEASEVTPTTNNRQYTFNQLAELVNSGNATLTEIDAYTVMLNRLQAAGVGAVIDGKYVSAEYLLNIEDRFRELQLQELNIAQQKRDLDSRSERLNDFEADLQLKSDRLSADVSRIVELVGWLYVEIKRLSEYADERGCELLNFPMEAEEFANWVQDIIS